MRPLLLGAPTTAIESGGVIWADPLDVERPPFGDAVHCGIDEAKLRDQLQRAMTAGAGGLRSAESLAETDRTVVRVAEATGPLGPPELRNLTVIARALLRAAAAREETPRRTRPHRLS